MTKFKVLLCPLVTSDTKRAVRAIQSCFIQEKVPIEFDVHVIINSKNQTFIEEISEYCSEKLISYSITFSDGTPSTGKNSVWDFFNSTDCTHLAQIDGDDFFYPSFLKHVTRHLFKFQTTDVLATIAYDKLMKKPQEGLKELENGLYFAVWESNYHDYGYHLGEDKIFDNTKKSTFTHPRLFSKKITQNFRYDPEFVVGEDYKLHYQMLHSHQKDEICYWHTSATDMWVYDSTSLGIQKKHLNTLIDGEYCIVEDSNLEIKLRGFVEKTMMRYRSAAGELPIDYAPMYLSIEEKIKFVNLFLNSSI